MINTSKLESFKEFLLSQKIYTDAYFVGSLIDTINKTPNVTKDIVDTWLNNAFSFPKNYDDFNCIETYNFSFYNMIMEKI